MFNLEIVGGNDVYPYIIKFVCKRALTTTQCVNHIREGIPCNVDVMLRFNLLYNHRNLGRVKHTWYAYILLITPLCWELDYKHEALLRNNSLLLLYMNPRYHRSQIPLAQWATEKLPINFSHSSCQEIFVPRPIQKLRLQYKHTEIL